MITSGSITAASALAQGVYFNNTLVAAANNDVLVGLDIAPTFTNGAFTGVSNIGLRVSGQVLFNAYGAYNTVTPTLRIENVDTNNVAIQIKGNVANYKYYWIYDSQTTEGIYKSDQARIDLYGGTNVGFAFRNNYGRLFTIVGTTGNVLINTTTDAGYKLDVNGTGRFVNTLTLDSNLTFGANNIVINSTAVFGRLSIYGTASASAAIAIGYNSTASNNSSVSIGYNSQNSGDRAVTIGADTSSSATNSVTIGRGSVGATDSFVSGSNLGTIADVYFGSGVRHASANTAGADYRINGSGASNNFNIAGGNIIIAGGKGTGTGTPGDVIFATSSLLGSTLTLQSLTNRVWIKGDSGNVGIGTSSPTDKFHIVDNTNGNKFGRISAGGTDASAAWVAQNDQVDNIVYRVFGSAVTGSQMGQALARSASLIANLGGTGKFLIGSFSGTDLIFGTSDQARMRLVDATGNFLIGTMTDTGNKLTVSGNIDAQGYKVNNVLGYTGILNIPTNPPGQQNIDIQGGIVINIF
ncbi:MAG: hypothetical protein EBR30_09225 [Cytophagia bacterium]|nr:hypothetical protein [Cytophagia bacterium]